MSNSIKVSIIIPVYNVEKFLKQCLESAVNQTLHEIEIIIVNDGSTDRSAIIVNEYSEKFRNLVIINQKNSGQSRARNKALTLAKGKYIYFLDSDDYIEIFAMEELYREAEKDNLDLILFDGNTFYDEEIKNKENYNFNYMKKHKYLEITNGHNFFAQLVFNKDYKCSPCLLFIKRSLMIENNILFFEGIIHEDELFTIELMLKSSKVKNLDKVFFHRRIRAGSTMTGNKLEFSFNSFIEVFYGMLNIEKQLLLENEFVKKAIITKIGYIYGSIINRYCYMSKEEKKRNFKKLKKLKRIAKQKKYFGQKHFRVFQVSISAYCILRKMYDSK